MAGLIPSIRGIMLQKTNQISAFLEVTVSQMGTDTKSTKSMNGSSPQMENKKSEAEESEAAGWDMLSSWHVGL